MSQLNLLWKMSLLNKFSILLIKTIKYGTINLFLNSKKDRSTQERKSEPILLKGRRMAVFKVN